MNPPQPVPEEHSSLPVLGMVFGLLSLTGILSLLSVPAIIISAIALKKTSFNKPLSITGLVSGIIGAFLSLLIGLVLTIAFIAILTQSAATDDASGTYSCYPTDHYCSDPSDNYESDPSTIPQSI